MPEELRREYRDRVAGLEDRVLALGDETLRLLRQAMSALADDDLAGAAEVVEANDRLDEAFADVRQGVFLLLARQAPVASELRFLSALLHTNIHVERMGDLAANVARLVDDVHGMAADAGLLALLAEMATHAERVARHSFTAFARRDADAAFDLPTLDEPVDRLNESIFRRLVDLAATDRDRLDWAMRMVLAARYLERLGDHAVDIGEQTIFASTGQVADL